jgi:hypothetical protein
MQQRFMDIDFRRSLRARTKDTRFQGVNSGMNTEIGTGIARGGGVCAAAEIVLTTPVERETAISGVND